MNPFSRLLALPLLLLFLHPAFVAPDFLVDADWLSEHIDDEHLTVLEVRYHPHRYFTVGHIPGAVQVQRFKDLGDNQGNPIEDGAVTFQAYDSGNCTGTALGAAVEVNLDAQGVADEPHSVEIMLENNPHVISYRAVYDGGSGLYEQTQANCEKVEFSYPQ